LYCSAKDAGVVERLHDLDLAVLDGALEHPDDAELQRRLLLHRRLQLLVELLLQRHPVPFRCG
jgi:hypothetical protein